jgi:serine/threonine-protein kinase
MSASAKTPIDREEPATTVYEAPSRPSIPPAAGESINGEYTLESLIGEGGVGSVYRAIQLKGPRAVAIKLLQRDSLGEMDMRPRFEREAMALSTMRHPNIVRFHDYGIADGRPYLVMDLIDGRTLHALIARDGALKVSRAIAICRQLLYALAYAHDRGLVHRDLKSANVMVQTLPHQPEHITILDFGFVKLLPGHRVDGAAPLTRAGVSFGSPPYISPEQATGSPIDARADLYSVGVLLFEMLTGTRPFDGEVTDVLRHHLATPVPKLSTRNPKLGPRDDLQALIERAMAKSRDNRFASADAMLAALDTVDHRDMSTTLTQVRYRAVRALRWLIAMLTRLRSRLQQ